MAVCPIHDQYRLFIDGVHPQITAELRFLILLIGPQIRLRGIGIEM